MSSSTCPTPPSSYLHEPLQSPSSIRVLDLLPSSTRDTNIRCNVRQVVLGSREVKFEALSYVWGARKGNTPITCNGKQLLVTPNCRDALIHLRQRFGVRTVWIDAICIDQNENPTATAERNRQVQMMGSIYRHAQGVIVWLGHGNSDRTLHIWRALKLLAAMRQAEVVADSLPRSIRDASNYVTKHADRAVQTKMLRYLGQDSDSTYAEFLQILENPWFFRVWTTQEVVFARRCFVMYGSASMDWTHFTIAIKRAHALHHSTVNTQMISFKDNMRDEEQCEGTKYASDDNYKRMHDLQLLKAMCKLDCSVPIDKIYGLYSIFEARSTAMPEPNYSKSSSEVLEEFAKAYTFSRNELDILRITLPPREDRGLPSWIPDWFEGVAVSELTRSDITGTRVICFDDFPSTISACRNTQACLDLSLGFGKLGVKGKLVGTIKTRVAGPFIGNADVKDLTLFEDFIRTCQQWCVMFTAATSYPTGEDPSLAGLRTIASHKSYAGPDIERESLKLWYNTMLGLRVQQRPDNTSDSTPQDQNNPTDIVTFIQSGNISRTQDSGETLKDAVRMQKVQQFINYKANYAAFVLDNGYFGSAFNTSREGDRIYLLAGLEVPCVLRPVGDEFRFIALAHVYGAMKGELWPTDEDELRRIILV